MTSWKIGLVVSFLVFYLGFGLLAFAWDLTQGNAVLQDVWTYVTFGKFVDYSQGFEKRAVDYFKAETGALKSDAMLSLFTLGLAQVSFILLIGTVTFIVIPSDKKVYFLLTIFFAFLFVSFLHFTATGDPVIGLLKLPQYWVFGVPEGATGFVTGIDLNVVSASG